MCKGVLSFKVLCIFLYLCSLPTSAQNFVPISVGDITIFVPFNAKPVVVDDEYIISERGDLCNVTSIGGGSWECGYELTPLLNDHDPEGTELRFVSPENSSKGNFQNLAGKDMFFPNKDFFLSDGMEVTYKAYDADGEFSEGTIRLIPNLAPRLTADSFKIPALPEGCPANDLTHYKCRLEFDPLANDQPDPDGDALLRIQNSYTHPDEFPAEKNGKYYPLSDLIVYYVPNGCFYGLEACSDSTEEIHYRVEDVRGATSKTGIIYLKGPTYTAPQPVVNKFSWEPDTVNVGEPTTFYWDIENVQSCYGNDTPRETSGTSGPWTYSKSEVHDTQWYCTDLNGQRFPRQGFLTATRTVVTPEPKVIQFEWIPSQVAVNEPTTFHWNIENVQSCVGNDLARTPIGTSGPWQYQDASLKTTQWACLDLSGNRFPETGFISTTLTVTSGTPSTIALSFAKSEVYVGEPVQLQGAWQGLSYCSAKNDGNVRFNVGDMVQIFTPTPGVITDWICFDSLGKYAGDAAAQISVLRLKAPTRLQKSQ